ncbi:hypothetical protein ABIB99_001582 [Bradyrhizobium sp. LA6.1]|uniref:potassium channel family protein n=1 Tax=Bradyrhizobium sp. LA6.1 TaxID=3156378 RepID=UPI0033972ADB
MHQSPLWLIVGTLLIASALCTYFVVMLYNIFRDIYGIEDNPLPSAIHLVRLLVALYLGLIYIFGVAFAGIYEFDRDAFSFSDVSNFSENVLGVFYLSAATMTSTGYGDIHPKSPAAMAAAIVEMLCGYFMTVLFFSAIAGLAFRNAERRR